VEEVPLESIMLIKKGRNYAFDFHIAANNLFLRPLVRSVTAHIPPMVAQTLMKFCFFSLGFLASPAWGLLGSA